ncbi:AAA family ATPase [Chelativorans sp.]|uniref:AAA family ATPase n=1 Tax=Chelativorans sp. TaxID=2203393 RepID=UPI0028124F09|nr:AAA family ATPase [Chelativorans sp.]
MNSWYTPEQMLAEIGAVVERYRPGEAVPSAPPPLPLETVSASIFASQATPRRSFLDGAALFPCRNVTMLSGDGGTGKSLLALQLAAAVVTGSKWLGIDVETGPVVYLSAEDDLDEMHIRLKDICAAENLSIGRMKTLELAVLAGRDAVLGTEAQKGGKVEMTPLFDRLRLKLARSRPRLLVLDNLADVFAGNENVRPLARQFVSALRGQAIEFDCVVLLLSHPSLSGINSGSGMSGNTAWNNSVRSRLYLLREKEKDGAELDPDNRLLQTMKSNYGPSGGQVPLRWQAGRFIRTDAPAAPGQNRGFLKAAWIEAKFLDLLRWHADKGLRLSPMKGPNYAPAVFARHPRAEGVTSRQFDRAMNVLLETARIEVETTGPPSKLRQLLRATPAPHDEDGRD